MNDFSFTPVKLLNSFDIYLSDDVNSIIYYSTKGYYLNFIINSQIEIELNVELFNLLNTELDNDIK